MGNDDIALKCRFWDQWSTAECKLVADEYMVQHERIAELECALMVADKALTKLARLDKEDVIFDEPHAELVSRAALAQIKREFLK